MNSTNWVNVALSLKMVTGLEVAEIMQIMVNHGYGVKQLDIFHWELWLLEVVATLLA